MVCGPILGEATDATIIDRKVVGKQDIYVICMITKHHLIDYLLIAKGEIMPLLKKDLHKLPQPGD